MLSYPRRLKSGHFTCYLNRTYHVLTTGRIHLLDTISSLSYSDCLPLGKPKLDFMCKLMLRIGRPWLSEFADIPPFRYGAGGGH